MNATTALPLDLAQKDTSRDFDRDILEALERGDRKVALILLMRVYGDPLYRYCYGVLRDRAMADDVHQTIFLQAYQSFGSFSRRSSLRSWVYAIAHHRCLDALKINRRWQKRFSLQDELPDQPDPQPSGDEAVAARSLATAVGECLGGLAAHVRTAVLLRYQEGFTYEKMGRMCNERAPTLQARVARAMPALRRCLESRGVEI